MARTGTRIARFLIRPPVPPAQGLQPDGWGLDRVPPALALRHAGQTARRAAGLGVLGLIGLLGASILSISAIFLGMGAASGSDVAGWMLGLVLLLGALGAVWLVRRARLLLRPAGEDTPAMPGAGRVSLAALNRQARALPAPGRAAFRRTLAATEGALRACAADTTLGRDTFDARQAAREDLPTLLAAYRAAPPTPDAQREFARQLSVIETRMHAIVRGRAAQQALDLHAHGRYVDDKYGREDDRTP